MPEAPSGGRSIVAAYRNLTGRPPGRLISLAARLSAGAAQVRGQITPYAEAWHEANARAVAKPGPRWVVLGDSMSVGVGASGPFDGWVGQAQHQLASSGHDVSVVNLAAYGARTEDVLAQQLPVWRALPPPAEGEVVSLFIGANDMLRRRWRRLLPANFNAVLVQLPAGAVVAVLPDRDEDTRRANASLARAEEAQQVRVVRLPRPPAKRAQRNLAGDHFHPDDVGYAHIADAFVPVLQLAFTALAARPGSRDGGTGL